MFLLKGSAMRLFLVLIIMLVSTSCFSDIYDKDGRYIGAVTTTTQDSVATAAIGAAAIFITRGSKTKRRVIESYDIAMSKLTEKPELVECDQVCKKEIQAEVIKKHKINN